MEALITTSLTQGETRLHFVIRLAVLLAGLAITAVITAGPALSSGNVREESYEKHGAGRAASKLYGTLEKVPPDRIGSWTVSGLEIKVTRETRIKEEHGKAVAGAYVEVEGTKSGTVFTADKIEVKRSK